MPFVVNPLRLVVVTPPAVEPVSLAEMRQELGVTLDADDAMILRKVRAARQYVERMLGFPLIATEFEVAFDAFPRGEIELPTRPLMSVTSVAYVDPAGVLQTVPVDDYEIDVHSAKSWIVPLVERPWPATMATINAVRVRFVAGMGASPDEVPELLREAIRELAAWWFEQREAAGEGSFKSIPFGVEDKLASWREWTF